MTCDDDGTSSRTWQLSPAWPHYRPVLLWPDSKLQTLGDYSPAWSVAASVTRALTRRQLRWSSEDPTTKSSSRINFTSIAALGCSLLYYYLIFGNNWHTEPRPVIVPCHDGISWKRGSDRHILQMFIPFQCLEKVYMTIEMFSPHTFIALNIEPNEKFSQAFHGAGHKCISRECFNWMRISQHLHTSKYRQIYQVGARSISGDIHTLRSTTAPGPCGTCDLCRPASTSWFWFLEFVFAPRKYLPSLW